MQNKDLILIGVCKDDREFFSNPPDFSGLDILLPKWAKRQMIKILEKSHLFEYKYEFYREKALEFDRLVIWYRFNIACRNENTFSYPDVNEWVFYKRYRRKK